MALSLILLHRPDPMMDANALGPALDALGNDGLVLQNSLATFDCRRKQIVTAGDHDVIFGEVLSFEQSEGAALLYWPSRFSECLGA